MVTEQNAVVTDSTAMPRCPAVTEQNAVATEQNAVADDGWTKCTLC